MICQKKTPVNSVNTKGQPMRYPKLLPKPATGEPWRPVMTEQQRKEHEQYVRENNLPF